MLQGIGLDRGTLAVFLTLWKKAQAENSESPSERERQASSLASAAVTSNHFSLEYRELCSDTHIAPDCRRSVIVRQSIVMISMV
jgi:hypothetical protein